MLGLFMKDLLILVRLKTIKYVLLMMVFVSLFSFNDLNFLNGYLGIFALILVMNTLSYDEYNHGYSYIFTLPIKRKDYLKEKYLLGLIVSIFVFILSNLIIYIIASFKGIYDIEYLFSSIIQLCVIYIMLSVMIPIQIKFGSAKSRIVLMVGAIGLFGVIFLLSSLIDVDLSWINHISQQLVFITIIATTLIVAISSYLVGKKLLNNMEF